MEALDSVLAWVSSVLSSFSTSSPSGRSLGRGKTENSSFKKLSTYTDIFNVYEKSENFIFGFYVLDTFPNFLWPYLLQIPVAQVFLLTSWYADLQHFMLNFLFVTTEKNEKITQQNNLLEPPFFIDTPY